MLALDALLRIQLSSDNKTYLEETFDHVVCDKIQRQNQYFEDLESSAQNIRNIKNDKVYQELERLKQTEKIKIVDWT